MFNVTVLRDALWNMSPTAGSDANYARGVLLGLVASLQAHGLTFSQAIAIASEHAPKTILYDSCPASWLEQFHVWNLKPASYKINNNKVWERTEGR